MLLYKRKDLDFFFTLTQSIEPKILDKLLFQMSLYYTQVKENNNILVGMFYNFQLMFHYFFEKPKFIILAIITELHYNG